MKTINKIYHAAIYVRLSKEDGDVSNTAKTESNSISNQKSLVREFLKNHKDIVIEKEYVDDGYSGSNFERPAFQMMLEDIKKGIIDCVPIAAVLAEDTPISLLMSFEKAEPPRFFMQASANVSPRTLLSIIIGWSCSKETTFSKSCAASAS